MRVGYIHDWKSTWFNERHFSEYLMEDLAIRDHIENKLGHAGLSEITIRKDANEVEVNIHTARPGIVIGKGGCEVDALHRELHRLTQKQVKVNVLEIKRRRAGRWPRWSARWRSRRAQRRRRPGRRAWPARRWRRRGRPWTPWRWRRSRLMLQPKRIKHRKQHRGRMPGNAKGGTRVEFGE